MSGMRFQNEIDAAYLASMLDHRARLAVTTNGVEVRMYLNGNAAEVLRILPCPGTVVHGNIVRFKNNAAATLLMAVWPHLKSERRKAQVQECFRWTRTLGMPLDYEAKRVRRDVRRKLLKLAGHE